VHPLAGIRIPVEVLNFAEGESRARAATLGLTDADLEGAINITAQINRMLEGQRSWYGLPAIVAEVAEKDCAVLGLGRLEYLQDLVSRHHEATVKNGPGFDREGPQAERVSSGKS
jgi:hypothetical protein